MSAPIRLIRWLSFGTGEPLYAPRLIWNDVRYYARHRRWVALFRTLFHTIVLHDNVENCQECGRRYFNWHAPDAIWSELIDPHGGGILCPRCFDRKGEAAGMWLCWVPILVARRTRDVAGRWEDWEMTPDWPFGKAS